MVGFIFEPDANFGHYFDFLILKNDVNMTFDILISFRFEKEMKDF